MVRYKVRILLPIVSGDTKDELKKTLGSIAKQTYGVDNIEVISVLYTNEPALLQWLLEYPLPYHAVYEKKIKKQGLIYYDVACISAQTWNIGIKYSLELQPGDELYENMIEVCVKICQKKHVGRVICEAGISSLGVGQKKLFKRSQKINAKNRISCLSIGPLHRVFCFEGVGNTIDKPNSYAQLTYEPHCWNYKFIQVTDSKSYYLGKQMGIIAGFEKWQDVSFAKILAHYLAILQFMRKYEGNKNIGIMESDIEQIYENLSCLALGMACVCGLKDEYEQAEDFLLFAKMVKQGKYGERGMRLTKNSNKIKCNIAMEIKGSLSAKNQSNLRVLLSKVMDGEGK